MITTRKVLIIEDDAKFARVLGRCLSMWGHVVDIATDGQAGLEKARELLPDVVICDLQLPDTDGWSIARSLTGSGDIARPIVLLALTGFGGSREAVQSLEAGFDLHLTKPLDFGRLEQVVSSLSVEPYTRIGSAIF